MKLLNWEVIEEDKSYGIVRAKVPGGWLVMAMNAVSPHTPSGFGKSDIIRTVCYVPDPHDAWQEPEKENVD